MAFTIESYVTRSDGCRVSQKNRIRKESNESSPFWRLHARQAGSRLSSSLVPPRDLGTMWSRVMLFTLSTHPQYAQCPAVLFRMEFFFVISKTFFVNTVCDSVFEVIGMLDFRSFVLKSFPIKSACVPSIFSRHRLS